MAIVHIALSKNRISRYIITLFGVMALGIILNAGRAQAATYTVTSTSPTGAGSLDSAIVAANASIGLDTIAFNIAGPGVHTITRNDGNAFTPITDPVLIDGTTQMDGACDGSTARPRISILASNTSNGIITFSDGSDGSTLQGLNLANQAITGNGIVLIDVGADGVTMRCNFVGLDSTGATGVSTQGVRVFAKNTVIGGNSINDRNFFGLCDLSGAGCIYVSSSSNPGQGVSGNIVRNNYIGTDVDGLNSAADPLGSGIYVDASDSVLIRDNLISGLANGIYVAGIVSDAVNDLEIHGNYIGVDKTGTAAIPNGLGIWFNGYTANTLVGTSNLADRNLISGNTVDGVRINTTTVTDTSIENNFIGVDGAGTAALGNGQYGIRAVGDNQFIYNNVISGNLYAGIDIQSTSNSIIAGNYIGTDLTQLIDLGNANYGIIVENNVVDLTIGGMVGNNIRNNGVGILISGAATTGTDISSNQIISNDGDGIELSDATTDSLVTLNNIESNGGAGIYTNSTGQNSFLENTIINNGGLGIDLIGAGGVNANDVGDGDTGSNNLLNFPVIHEIAVNGGNTDITYILDVPAGSYRIDICENPSGQDPSGYGECEAWVASEDRNSITSGPHIFTMTIPGNTYDFTKLAMTTTIKDGSADGYGATSELGNAVDEVAYLSLVLVDAPVASVMPGSTVTYGVLLTNNGPNTINTITVNIGNTNCSTTSEVIVNANSTAQNIGTYNSGSGVWSGSMQAGEVIYIQVTCTVTGSDMQSIAITADIASSGFNSTWPNVDPNLTNDSDSLSVLIQAIEDLAVSTYTLTAGPINAGDTVTQRLNLSNIGSGATTISGTVAVAIALPEQASYVSFSDPDLGDDYSLSGCLLNPSGDAAANGFPYAADLIICVLQSNTGYLNPGDSFDADITMTANANFVSGGSLYTAMFFDFTASGTDPDYPILFPALGVDVYEAVTTLTINNVDTFYYDDSELQPTINRCAGQANPTTVNDVCFRVSFNKPINEKTFSQSDLTVTNGVIYSFIQIDHTTWEVRINGMLPGQVSLSIINGSVTDKNAYVLAGALLGDNTARYDPAGAALAETGQSTLIWKIIIVTSVLSGIGLLIGLRPRRK